MASLGTAFGAPVAHAGYRTEAGDFVAPQVILADAGLEAERASEMGTPAPAESVCKELSARAAAAYLGWAYGTFRNNAKKKGIKKLRNGRYSIKELDKWKNYGRSENQ